jgi:predicted PurR-regulated permease PerM
MTGDSKYFTNPRVSFLFVIAAAITVLFFLVVRGFLIAVFFGALLSGLLHPLYRRISRALRGRRSAASGVTVVLTLLLVIIPLLFFLGLVVNEAVGVSNQAREWFSEQGEIAEILDRQIARNPWLEKLRPYQNDIVAKAGNITARAGSVMAQGLAAGVKGTASFVLSLFVMLYAMFYFLIDEGRSLRTALHYTPLTAEDGERLLAIFHSVTRATVKGKVIIGVLQAGLAALALWLAGIGGVFFWFALMCVLSVIPAFGTTLVWVPAVVYLALTGNGGKAVAVAVWCALVVGSIDNILTPRLIGKDTKMPDLLVLLATLGGILFFGASGILVGPIVGALFLSAWQMWGGAIDAVRTPKVAEEPQESAAL